MKALVNFLFACISVFGAQQLAAQTYCTPNFNPQGCWLGDDVNSFTIGTFSDLNTGCTGNGYADRTSVGTIALTVGASTSFSITSSNGGFGMFYAIWIDLNNNGDFGDANEFVWNGAISGVGAGSFVVPAGSGTRRLRVLAKYTSTPLTQSASCQGGFWGEIQDYSCLIGSASCAVPSALTANTIKSNGATLAWTGTGTKYRIEYGIAGFTQGAGTLDSSTTNSKVITGLNATTAYDYYVKNICSSTNQSGWNGPYTFTTICATISTFPFTENFDASPWVGSTFNNYAADAISPCWTRFPTYVNFIYAWALRTGGTTNPNTGPSSDASGQGNYMQAHPVGNSTIETAVINLPVFDFSTLVAPLLEFKYHMFGSNMGNLYVEASTNGGQTWVKLDSLIGEQQLSKTANWLLRSVDLSSVKSSLTYVRFRSTSNISGIRGDLAIDEIRVEDAPPCLKPGAPFITNLLGNGATVNWTSSANNFYIEYGLAGYTQGTGTVDTVSNATSYAITNLLGETYYDIYLQADCGTAGLSAWYGPITIRTHTLPPFVEDFTGGFLPDLRWVKAEGTLANPTVFNTVTNSQWGLDGFANVGSTGAARVGVFTSSIRSDWFLTKSIDLGTTTNWELYFDIALTASGTNAPSVLGADDNLKIIISTDNGATWNLSNVIRTIDATANLTNTATLIKQSLAGYTGVVKFGFYMESTTGSPNNVDLFIDNLGVRYPGACPAPSALATANVAATSLDLLWVGDTAVTSYSIEYGPSGFVQGSGTFINNITTTSSTISGLSPITGYDFYVRSDCGSTISSSWTGPYNVVTGCPQVFATPYYTDFEINSPGAAIFNGKMNNCWVATPFSAGYYWRTGVSGQYNPKNSGPAFDNTFQTVGTGKYVYASASAGPDAKLLAGPFDLSNLNQPTLEFYYHMYGSGMGNLHVDLSTDESTWILDVVQIKGQQQTSDTAKWKLAVAPLSQFLNDTVYIRIRAEYGTSYLGDIAIDDFRIFEATSCQPPNSLTANSITSTTAVLSWGTYAPSTTIEYSLAGFIQGTGAGTVVHNASPNMVITGLLPNTTYDYYVKDTCVLTSGSQSWVGPYTFKTACLGTLSGTYTIGGPVGPNNFVTLGSAIAALNDCGISGPVVFNLTGVKQVGAFEINAVVGASATNTIRFNGTLGLDTIVSATVDYLIRFNGASYITFNNITFVNTSGYTVLWFTNSSNHITIQNSTLHGKVNPGGSAFSVINAGFSVNNPSSQGHNAHHLNIVNNRFIGGYSTLSINGVPGEEDANIYIANNVFDDVDSRAISIWHMDSVTITGNVVNGTSSSGSGVYLYKSGYTMVSKNQLAVNGKAIYIDQNIATKTTSLVNNAIIATFEGISTNQVSGLKIYHNSINSNAYGIYNLNSMANADIRNNIIVTNLNSVFYAVSAPTTSIINYNLYKTNSSSLATIGSTNYGTLAAWQAGAPAYNANSVYGDPVFYSATDLQTTGTAANNVGDNTVGVVEDFNGDARPAAGATVVDMGAYEYTPKLNDAELVALYEPSFACGSAAADVKVIVKNLGLNTITSLPITVKTTGGITSTLNYTYTGSLATRAQDTVTIGTLNTLSSVSTVTIQSYTSLLNDEDASNDTVARDFNFIPLLPQFAVPDSVCHNATSATVNAQAIPGVTYSWYPSATATTAADTGATYNFNPSVQNTWYLGYGYDGADLLVTAMSANYGAAGGIMFNLEAKRNISIDSLELNLTYAVGATAPVSIYYLANQTVAGNAQNAAIWKLHDSKVITTGGVTQTSRFVLSTPLNIPLGSVYAIYVYAPTAWLNVNSASPQVYDSKFMRVTPGVGLYSLFAIPEANHQFSGYVYASEFACTNTRVMVQTPLITDSAVANFTATVSQPDRVDVDASASQGQVYAWDFGDGTTGAGITATHNYTNGGNYTITCVVTDTVCNTTDTATFSVNMTIGVTENELTRSINIFPNPSTGVFNLTFDMNSKEDVTIVVIDALGRTLSSESFKNESGNIALEIDLSNQARGLYFVHITAGNNTVVKKITKM